VDDDPEVLTFISRCLQAEGYVVDCCTSGQDALEYVASREYGLVLLDIAMPGLDGWETCRSMKSDASLAGIRVYLVTAKPIDGRTVQIQEVGADGYLLKPFKPEDLTELVRGVVSSRRAKGM
jgi:DNA-binding response OmpR family regulator